MGTFKENLPKKILLRNCQANSTWPSLSVGFVSICSGHSFVITVKYVHSVYIMYGALESVESWRPESHRYYYYY